MKPWVVVPVNSLQKSKSRLSEILTVRERADLTLSLLSNTLAVVANAAMVEQLVVVSPDQAVLDVAQNFGAQVLLEDGRSGLNKALCKAIRLKATGIDDSLLVLPCDLPWIGRDDISCMVSLAADHLNMASLDNGHANLRLMIINPDQQGQGTNALFLYPAAGFEFQFGPGSYYKHLDEAARLNMICQTIRLPGIAFDLDTENDWISYQEKTHLRTSTN